MEAERDMELPEPAREPWSTPVLRQLSAVDAEASEGLNFDGLGSS
jgi:hypothetical protein